MDDKLKGQIAKESRLWLLGVVCAVPGAVAAAYSGSWFVGFGVFVLALLVFGPLLWWFEKRRR